MIQISKIDDRLSIYKENVVFLIGINDDTDVLIDLLKSYNVELLAIFHDKQVENGKYKEINVLPLEYLGVMAKQTPNIVLQISSTAVTIDFQQLLVNRGIQVQGCITYKEAIDMLWLIQKFDYAQKSPMYCDALSNVDLMLNRNLTVQFFDYVCNNFNEEILVLFTSAGLGENEILSTIKQKKIEYINMKLNPFAFDKVFIEKSPIKVKILLGISEPIIQNIINSHILLEKQQSEFEWELTLADEDFFSNGGNASRLLEIYDKHYGTSEFNKSKQQYCTFSIATLIKGFNENVIDLMQYPFDKDKGYSIIAENNIEVFVFQYEKIDILAKEISTWIGSKKFNKWENKFTFGNHWLATSFNNAMQEIEFSREYFNRMYSDQYINHFYCEDDIANFKARWEKHIKD